MNKLIIRNNWEDYEYYVNNVRIEPYNIKKIYDEHGNEYTVRRRTESVNYNDMGHTYTAYRTVLVVDHPLGDIIIRPESEVYIKELEFNKKGDLL